MTTTETTAKFNRILNLEAAVRLTSVARAFRGAGVSDYSANRQDASISADRARLFAAVEALTTDEMVEFGEYRKGMMA